MTNRRSFIRKHHQQKWFLFALPRCLNSSSCCSIEMMWLVCSLQGPQLTVEHVLFALTLGKMRQNWELTVPIYAPTTELSAVVLMILVFILKRKESLGWGGERQSSHVLLNTKFREKSHWEKKADRPGSAEGFTGGLLGQWTHFIPFMLMNLCLPQALASSYPAHCCCYCQAQLCCRQW